MDALMIEIQLGSQMMQDVEMVVVAKTEDENVVCTRYKKRGNEVYIKIIFVVEQNDKAVGDDITSSNSYDHRATMIMEFVC